MRRTLQYLNQPVDNPGPSNPQIHIPPSNSPPPPLPLKTIRTLAMTEITEWEVEKEEHCAICRVAFTAGEIVTNLKCLHNFHFHCIRRWLRITRSCPNCRKEIVP